MMTYRNMIGPDAGFAWKKSDAPAFWKEVAASDHLVQIYENDGVLLAALEGFVTSGFKAGHSVIVIATDEHLGALNSRLLTEGFKTRALYSMDVYIPVNAEEALSKFMINGWPDETLFSKLAADLMTRARGKNHREVRAYGEMVALLWKQGNRDAALRLEHLWNRFSQKESFCLFCAYPKRGFMEDKQAHESIHHICSAHSKVIAGDVRSTAEIFYKKSS